MIRFPLFRKKKNVDLCQTNNTKNKNNITASIIKRSSLFIHHECNKDLSNDNRVISYCIDDTDSSTTSSSSSDPTDDNTTRRYALNIQNQDHNIVVKNTTSNKKKIVRFHETTNDSNSSNNDSKTNKRRELISFDEKKSSYQTWYSVTEIKAFKKYHKAYAKYLLTINPNDIIDVMIINDLNSITYSTEKNLICLRGMEKFIPQRSSSDKFQRHYYNVQ